MVDASAFQFLLLMVVGWLARREREALAYLIAENRVLRQQLGGRRLRLTDDDRWYLAVRAYRVVGIRLAAAIGAAHPGWRAVLVDPTTALRAE